MTPLSTSTASHSFSNVPFNNPLKDPNVIKILVGCIAGGVVLVVIIALILCLYRDRHPFDKCGGRRKRKTNDLEILSEINSAVFAYPKHPQKPS
jgi:hypothetical protein